jgi:catechol-2,3-dioxygenase
MIFRYARHTNDLNKIEKFYTKIVGLEKIGDFENHNKYDGIFLGLPGSDWHLEFTTSDEKAIHEFDEDDVLVFYLKSQSELESLKNKIYKNSIELQTPKNPYWRENGIMFSDPDGYKIVFSVTE